MKLPFKDEAKTEHSIEENISVGIEYAAIGEMIHQALGESRIIHERESLVEKDKDNVIKTKRVSNPDVDKIKKTAEQFLNMAFREYAKERIFRFSTILLSKFFFSLYLAFISIFVILLLVFNNVIPWRNAQIILFVLVVIIVTILIIINGLKNKVFDTNKER